MTGRSDITRWNRAGLRRLRYVDANAATYLEELRVRLAERFPVWQAIQRTGAAIAAQPAQLVEQYLAPRSAVPDWGWEIARALARACHVLGEHVDAFANESYLSTATQWESLRRLVALVDYHPAPPASAFTHLVLIARPGAAGDVPPGLAISPAAPDAGVVFETMEALAIDSVVNELRPQGFDRNPEVLSGNQLELDGQVDGLALGEPVVIESEIDGSAWARRIAGIAVGAGATTVQVAPDLPDGVLVRGRVVVHAQPKDRLAALGPSTTSSVIGKARTAVTTALPRTTVNGDFVVAIRESTLAWGVVASIVRDESAHASITPVSPWQRTDGDLLLGTTTVFGHFTQQLRLAGWNRNPTPITGSDIPLAVPAQAASLTVGRKLVVYRPDAPERGYLTAVSAVIVGTLRLRDGLPAGAGFTRDNLRIAGNVAAASHGERRPERVLGSGDATLTGQRFVLAQQAVSFVPDPTQPRGVRADVEVIVDGRIWQQVGSLRDFGPADPVYTVKITEDDTLDLAFGDGRTGRRLPTGRNNVRIRARVGVGLTGNVPAGTLTRIARPHPLVSAVQQPLPTVGGNDRETADSLRRTAPTTLLTLDRCVSPADFAALAAAHASIWQARAFVRPSTGTRAHLVEVVVVPANGAELGELAQTLATFLESRALPNVDVTVTRFLPLPILLAVTVEIDLAAFDPAAVLRDVRAALYGALSLRRRQLGQPVFLGDVYAVVENVPGVSTSRCVLGGDPAIHRLQAVSDSVLFLDPASPETLGLTYEARP